MIPVCALCWYMIYVLHRPVHDAGICVMLVHDICVTPVHDMCVMMVHDTIHVRLILAQPNFSGNH